ncbi:glutamate--cysteine ligase [Lacticaseibacillus casei]|uniref:Glutamate--cysteine ligase n=1 Tax=Lacticaseibacillus huelsenbergensis TaxID=3035291 RepID=A0ABY8DUJ3_9LACO|nr:MULTISPECIES: glutamate--cysteine ligase [Lacticaseibacillus]MDG3061923.1 glutamate--cysteine ligase [Lacticaseibacillus sp. BCRC 81376]QVI38758.1 glutamate--cysteine ligase [Lacticaseibacillus casei]QXG60577.1 glutamate--cysteine ligase [Lacticaseibacillus casei]WFB40675.1 glutamate--cysteine ligase [Lacticaseibacillus huelsenbergensis]WFB43421.1 glutamate--cysteine ligase [Lacticaseibacillus huelsenbergensis]
MVNHYWQLIQKQHLSDLATQTRLGVVRTVKPVLPEGAQLAAWPQLSRHALVQPLSASTLQVVTPLLDDFAGVIAELRAGLSRIWANLPEDGRLPVFSEERVNQQVVRIVLPETLFERLYTAENFQGQGPDYVAYRNEVYDLVANGLMRQLPLLTDLFAATPLSGHQAFWPSSDQERQLVQKVTDPDHLDRTLALDVMVELDPYTASGITSQMLTFLRDSCWFALSQPAIPVAVASEVRRHALEEARKIAAMEPATPVKELTATMDAMATWLNHMGMTAQQKQAFELMQTRLMKPETTVAGQVAAAFGEKNAAAKSLSEEARTDLAGTDGLPGMIDLSGNTQALVQAAIDGGYQFTLLDRQQGLVQIATDTQTQVIVDGTITKYTPGNALLIATHRHAAKKLLAAAGIPVARGAKFTRWSDAKSAFERSFAHKSIVVKPEARSQGVAVEQFAVPPTEKQFASAFHEANRYHGVLIEMMARGTTYHFTIVSQQVLSVLETAAANVVGDGRKAIKELVALKNGTRPAARQLQLDAAALRQLKLQSVTPETVLRRGQQIFLATAAHPQTGGDLYDVMDEIDPSYKKLAVEAAAALDLPVAAVDIVIDNLYAAYDPDVAGQAVVISVNPAPDLTSPQQPDMGTPRFIAPKLLNWLFAEK